VDNPSLSANRLACSHSLGKAVDGLVVSENGLLTISPVPSSP
jgi:hypothetical protein